MQKNRVKQWKNRKRAAAFCLAGVLAVSLAGCGGKSGDGGGGTGVEDAGTGETSDGGTAMGRYVETMTDVDSGKILDLKALSDGRLALLENGAFGRWVSEDNGVTWEPDLLPGWHAFLVDNSVYDMKAAPDGSVAVLYKNYGSEESAADEEDALSLDNAGRNNGIWLIPAQGEAKQIELPQTDSDKQVHRLCFSEDGSRLFVASLDQKIYEVDREAGTVKLFLTADIKPDMLCVWENYMAIKNEGQGVAIYHLDTAEQIEDDVITDFVNKNCAVNKQILESTYSIFPAEEKGIYLVCGKGIYRHVIGGTVMEQVINGGLCSLSDPMKHVAKVIRTEDEGFMAAFSEGKISSFSYDPNITTLPAQTLTAYSLTENDILRQAILRYQGEHPDVYVEYKVGMDKGGATTREDAVKKLNTEIMAGKGPDFLLLDGLPVDSYVEKGVLADLTPYLTEMEKEEKILPNIRESFTTDGKIYMIPTAITISLYMTDQENMTGVSDLTTLADMIEKLRSEHPGEGIIETYSKDMILNALMPVSAPLWIEDGGRLNTEEMAAYLEQTKRIYDACMEGLPEKLLQQYLDLEQEGVKSGDEISAYNDLMGGGVQIVAGNAKVALGELKNAYNYAFLKSVNKTEKGADCQTALMPGSVKDSFCPYALMGINAASGQGELAGGLLREALSKDTQSLIYPSGFPVNEAGLQTYLETQGGQLHSWAKPGMIASGFGFSDDDGTHITMSIYVPTEQETKELYDLLSSVRTPYLADTVVEDAVREVGKRYLEDRCSLEEAVELVQEKLAIYMSE